ncbi:MAG: hypothetical protein KGD68_05825 [Candidatus Lokiarchaeota archaeon]|nr:hypothetical protein [Candidatus Lokiarchaeota archaeon]
MKKLNKYILIGITSLILICPFLIPITKAQETTYDGVDTTNIPDFSVYPSEMYVINVTGMPPGILAIIEIAKGNMSDPLMIGNGTCVWGNFWIWNITSGEKTIQMTDTLVAYWNETVGFGAQNIPFIIPVETNGIVSLPILNNVSLFYEGLLSSMNLEHKQVFPSIYSMAFWNTTVNDAYFKANYTEDGIITNFETYLIPAVGNLTLYSQPAQLPPDFSFTAEGGAFIVDSPYFKIETTINDADNNNDGVTDTDYLFRILNNGSTWTSWATPTSLLDWDLGAVAAGNYNITMQVKNMYGVTQEQITIEYIPPPPLWSYDGANTERIPEFSIYPSEWYIHEINYLGMVQNHSIVEIGDAGIRNTFNGMNEFPPYYGTFTNGTIISYNIATWNITNDDPFWVPGIPDDAMYWNGTAYLAMGGMFTPINESTGTVTENILDSFLYYIDSTFTMMTGSPFEHRSVYPNTYSVALWNETDNTAHVYVNFTADGIIQSMESYNVPFSANATLYSQPAQLPPVFSLSTDDDILTINSTDFKIATTITDADNNNDGVTDTDYLFRILNGSTWTDWAAPTSLLDWDLGSVPAGNYTITIQVKNMYGVTQEQITIEYIPPAVITDGDGDGFVSGYPIFLVSMVAILGIIIITYRYRKKMKF